MGFPRDPMNYATVKDRQYVKEKFDDKGLCLAPAVGLNCSEGIYSNRLNRSLLVSFKLKRKNNANVFITCFKK